MTVVAITWNLFGSLPPTNSLLSLSKSAIFKPAPDIIFFGSQECERSLLRKQRSVVRYAERMFFLIPSMHLPCNDWAAFGHTHQEQICQEL